MNRLWIPGIAVAAAIVAATCGHVAGDESKPVREGADEVLYLDGLGDPNRWSPADCTVVASEQLKADGRATLHMHIPVDHHGGEKNHPIGWPRMYLNLKPAERAWGEFERFEFLVYATMSRKKPPRQVINLQVQCPDKASTHRRNLAEIRLGKWVPVSIPVRGVKSVEKVARLGLNISESDYRHGEKLDFYFGAFRLARAAEFGLARIEVRSRVMYADRPMLKVVLDVVGPEREVAKGVPLTIRRGAKAVHEQTVPVKRALQTVSLDLAKAGLEPGTYTVVAFAGDEARERASPFRIVESPWPEDGK
ncbi:MAG: hypothetical protein WBF17_16155 [Phycisphaerae bacterium]